MGGLLQIEQNSVIGPEATVVASPLQNIKLMNIWHDSTTVDESNGHRVQVRFIVLNEWQCCDCSYCKTVCTCFYVSEK